MNIEAGPLRNQNTSMNDRNQVDAEGRSLVTMACRIRAIGTILEMPPPRREAMDTWMTVACQSGW